MAKNPGNLAIGGFIAGALVLLFFLLIFISGGSFFSNSERYVMYFDGSVQGLQPGAPVKLKGVELGQIVEIDVILLPDGFSVVNMITADLDFDRIRRDFASDEEDLIEAVIEAGLRAQLNYQSLLTGLLYVELDFFPGTPITLLNLQDDYREFPTRQTEIQQIIDEVVELDLQSMITDIRSVIQSTDALLGSGRVEAVLDDFSAAMRSLGDTAAALELTVRDMGADVKTLSTSLDQSLSRLDRLMVSADEALPALSEETSATLAQLRETMANLESVADGTGRTLSEDSLFMNRLTRAAEDVSRAARAVQQLSEMLEQEPQSLLRGR